jgi:hypothetical protein
MPEIPMWIYFGGPCNIKCWYVFGHLKYLLMFNISILWLLGTFYGCLVYLIAVWYTLWLFGICNGCLVYFVVIWYTFPRFGMLYQEKPGNPKRAAFKRLISTTNHSTIVRIGTYWYFVPRKSWQSYSIPKFRYQLPFSHCRKNRRRCHPTHNSTPLFGIGNKACLNER